MGNQRSDLLSFCVFESTLDVENEKIYCFINCYFCSHNPQEVFSSWWIFHECVVTTGPFRVFDFASFLKSLQSACQKNSWWTWTQLTAMVCRNKRNGLKYGKLQTSQAYRCWRSKRLTLLLPCLFAKKFLVDLNTIFLNNTQTELQELALGIPRSSLVHLVVLAWLLWCPFLATACCSQQNPGNFQNSISEPRDMSNLWHCQKRKIIRGSASWCNQTLGNEVFSRLIRFCSK